MNISLKHVGWATNRPDLFEKFWVKILGFKKVWESKISSKKTKVLFGMVGGATCRRYTRKDITIEIHIFDNGAIVSSDTFNTEGLNHICLQVDNREDFLKLYDFTKTVYKNPEGHENVFIRDFEGNYIEIFEQL